MKKLLPKPNEKLWLTKFIYKIMDYIPYMSLNRYRKLSNDLHYKEIVIEVLENDMNKLVEKNKLPFIRFDAENIVYEDYNHNSTVMETSIRFEPLQITNMIPKYANDDLYQLHAITAETFEMQIRELSRQIGDAYYREMKQRFMDDMKVKF